MAIDLESILRRLETKQPNLGVNTNPAAGTGLTGISGSGGSAGAPSGLQTGYKPGGSSGLGSSTRPNYGSIDDMGFDKYYEQGIDSIGRRLADARSKFDMANQRDAEDYERAIRDSQQQQQLDAGALLDKMANQGLLRSGINVKAQTDLGESYQRRMADYERARNESRTGRESEFASFQQALNDEKAGLQQERARREAEAQKEAARLAAQQAQMNQLGQYQLPTGMTTDQFRDPRNTELQNNYGQILNQGPAVNEGAPRGPGADAPGAGDSYAAWDQPQSVDRQVKNYLQAVYEQEQRAVKDYLEALYRAGR